MRSMTTTGRFITFEGGEGAGKTTQARRLAERLRILGREVVETREPGGSPGAEAMRLILLKGIAKPLGTEAEAMLFAAARDDHMVTTIRPALERGEESNRFEEETLQFHRELRAAYREIAEGEPDRCVLIEADQSPDVVAVHIWMAVQERLLRPLREGQAPRAAG